jgi:hypothetical protein
MLDIVAIFLNIKVSAALKYSASGKAFITKRVWLFFISATSPKRAFYVLQTGLCVNVH